MPGGKKKQQQDSQRFLAQFYPFHYEVGFAVERAMRDPRLSQQQSIILWIIHSAGNRGTVLARKDIETRLGPWFNVSSSAMSKAIRGMAQPPLKLLRIVESPLSGREKDIHLSAAGERAVEQMMQRGEAYIGRITSGLSAQEIQHGLRFLQRVGEIVRGFAPAQQEQQG